MSEHIDKLEGTYGWATSRDEVYYTREQVEAAVRNAEAEWLDAAKKARRFSEQCTYVSGLDELIKQAEKRTI